MAKKRRRRMTQERFTRAQPRELKTIRLRVDKPVKYQYIIPEIVNLPDRTPIRKKKITKYKNTQLQVITKSIVKTPSCQAKKADSRHNYFSMRKSGKGASRTNPQTDRFNSRC